MDNAPICFDDWEHALRTSVPADRRHAYREAIVKFRYWLRETCKLPDAATFKDLLGHADISTTQIYLHTAKHTGIGVRSPFDTL